MPTNTPAFSPIIATPSPVKNDVPIVQDAAGTYPRRKPTLQLSIESCAAFNCVIQPFSAELLWQVERIKEVFYSMQHLCRTDKTCMLAEREQ